jgi:hypothetical protein
VVTPRSDVRVGVTGHRRLGGREGDVEAAIGGVLDEIRSHLLPPDGVEPVTVISPLAEGADRAAARAALTRGMHLEVLLPLPVDDYRTDFAEAASRQEFDTLLARAGRVEVVAPQPTRDDAYREVGIRTLDTCDVLLAVWDGAPPAGRGGTAEIVEQARRDGKPVAWIRVDQDPEVPASEHPLVVTRERWRWTP